MGSLYNEVGVFSGNANPALALAVCEYINIPQGRAQVFEFSNENIFCKIEESVRGNDIYVIQPLSTPVNRSIMELLIMIDAFKRASAGRITAVVPYYAYGRTDKKDQPRVPITARLLADMITVAGAHRLMTVDLHSGQIEGFFNIPVDNLTAIHILADYFKDKGLDNPVVVSPDLGSAKRARNFAQLINAPLAIVEKRRMGNDDRSSVLNLIGSVEGKQAILIDDEIDTAGSITQAADTVKKAGATAVYAGCVHAVLSGPAVQRLKDSCIEELVLTDTIPLQATKQLDKIKVISIARLLGEGIMRVHSGASVGAMFPKWK
ncbi:MAG: ribose-phosphate pyrophosphokinase [Chloroflexi bacterium]|uniref:Ribose-phosphate pyrophosphokinase n=1 Tax=Candidatus Chlorohelix allophototropha TaxID=3003348 RepID=A0A8T7LRD0_9CHLR|nr:ribose-phosphate pyrophosphokinase [Chloroflexota bacterium]WJW66439.1 ribose-phosphate pyrophosphokinase [Chloroflexota bacterium L227-S17]